MRKTLALLGALLLASALVPAKRSPRVLRPVFTPSEAAKPYGVRGDLIGFKDPRVVVFLRPLRAQDEEAFFKKHTGRPMRIFFHSDGSSPFIVFRIMLKNPGRDDLRFNATYVSLKSKRGRYAQALSLADMYESYHRLPAWSVIQSALEKTLCDEAFSLAPRHSATRLLVFRNPFTPRDKKAVMECSWVYVGSESFHLLFPYDVAWERLENGSWGKRSRFFPKAHEKLPQSR